MLWDVELATNLSVFCREVRLRLRGIYVNLSRILY